MKTFVLSSLLTALSLFSAFSLAHGSPAPEGHVLGWTCFNLSDARLTQITAFNKEAPDLAIYVPKSRLHIDITGPASAGRVCAPTVVKMGQGPLPPETIVFEYQAAEVHSGNPATAEIILTPEDPALAELSTQIVAHPNRWLERSGVLTYQAPRPLTFPTRAPRGLPETGPETRPQLAFSAATVRLQHQENCQPAALNESTIATPARRNGDTLEATDGPLIELPSGHALTLCDGLSPDAFKTAAARPHPDRKNTVQWLLIPRNTPSSPLSHQQDPTQAARLSQRHPLGDYHLCRQPGWTTSTVAPISLAQLWELHPDGTWTQLSSPSDPDAPDARIDEGQTVSLIDYDGRWALIELFIADAQKTLAVPASHVSIPSGPTQKTYDTVGGTCYQKGQWRATAGRTMAYRAPAGTDRGSDEALERINTTDRAWLELPEGTHLLQVCEDGQGGATTPSCRPIYVGHDDSASPFVLVQFAGSYAAVRESDLRSESTGSFQSRLRRPPLFESTWALRDIKSGWALSIGPGARASFVNQEHHAWALHLETRQLSLEGGWAFEGGVGFGIDSLTNFILIQAGATTQIYAFPDIPLELRAGVGGQLDLRVGNGGGMGFDLLGKIQLRWNNDFTPVTFETGLNLGYGGVFGPEGKGYFQLGMPFKLLVDLISF